MNQCDCEGRPDAQTPVERGLGRSIASFGSLKQLGETDRRSATENTLRAAGLFAIDIGEERGGGFGFSTAAVAT